MNPEDFECLVGHQTLEKVEAHIGGAVKDWRVWDMFAPPALISFLLMRYADLEPYRQSAFGKYIARSMSHSMEAIRLAGLAIAEQADEYLERLASV